MGTIGLILQTLGTKAYSNEGPLYLYVVSIPKVFTLVSTERVKNLGATLHHNTLQTL